jgi:hypothetical protein
MELYKPILLPSRQIESGKGFKAYWFRRNIATEEGPLRFRGYFYNQDSTIYPENWRGLVIRIKYTAIGGPDGRFMDYPFPGDSIYMPWTYGEVYVDEGLEDAMSINRSSFDLNHPHYIALKKFINQDQR